MDTSTLSKRKIKIWFLISWLFVALIQAYSLYHAGFGWLPAVTDSGVTYLLLFGATLLIGNNLRYYHPQKKKYLSVIAWCFLYTGLVIFINDHLLVYLLPRETAYLAFLQQTLLLRFGIAFIIITWMTMVSLLWYSLQEKIEEEKRKATAEKMAKEAELYKLRQQLQPHFLFNSLNSISALSGSRPAEARKMIHQLSDFLRGTLRKEDEQWIKLAEELQHLQLYLEIEKVRFGNRLMAHIKCDEACADLQLPPMLLQPVVENAIKFGLYDTIDEVSITIQAQAQPHLLVISVQNPFDPQTATPRHGTGFGLNSIRRRLYLLFGRNDLLETRAEQTIFTTTLKIPQP